MEDGVHDAAQVVPGRAADVQALAPVLGPPGGECGAGQFPARIGQVTGIGVGSAETVRQWIRRDQVGSGQRPGTTSEGFAEVKALKKEVAEVKRANEVLKAAASFLAAGLDRPHLRSWRSSTGTGTASAAPSRSAVC
ncbi:transposase [Streptomyces sp. enrichment culture]|uniref:transposase n=1 Tax=Streptomyces sp. enrichment culture TaxID=1795815 RepID=UPI003F57B577